LSPRQKMINLMYLVFIAMLALNMSKEVLSAFGSINEKLDRANSSFTDKNTLALNNLAEKAGESEEFKDAAQRAQAASKLSNAYYSFLATEKAGLTEGMEDPTKYESMDKSQYLDEKYYKGGKMTEAGQTFIAEMDKYRNGMVALIGDKNKELVDQIKADFSTDDVVRGKGAGKVSKDYISYHFVGFPSVSSLTKMTQLQNDIKVVENELLSALLSGGLTKLASYDNYTTLLEQPKGAWISGEAFTGSIALGRKDNATQPSKVELKLDGRALSPNQYETSQGKVSLKIPSGNPGEHKITGKLIYHQDGKDIEVPVDQSFTTIGAPKQATVSADKMNVVYRGVVNPMTISMAGVSGNNVSASAPGGVLKKVSGNKYEVRPGTGKNLKISVVGKIDGKSFPSSADFRIKDIPRPVGTVRNDDSGSMKMTREALSASPVGAALPDFDFELNLKVSSFNFRVPGKPTVKVNGARLNGQAKKILASAKRGATVQITDIKAGIQGNSGYKLRKISPVVIELSN